MIQHRRHLTPEERWEIVCAPDEVTDSVLADRLNVTVSAVHNARWHHRRHGWSTRIVYAVCGHCGGPLVRPAKHLKAHAYHPQCRRPALRAINARLQIVRQERMTAETRQALLVRAHEHTARMQQASIPGATARGQRWTAADDADLLARFDEPAHVLAEAFGRTVLAVKKRKYVLRRRTGADEPLQS